MSYGSVQSDPVYYGLVQDAPINARERNVLRPQSAACSLFTNGRGSILVRACPVMERIFARLGNGAPQRLQQAMRVSGRDESGTGFAGGGTTVP